MKEKIYFSDVRDGKLQRNIAKMIADDLRRFDGKRVCIRLGIKRKNRSLEQNAYYFGVICECFQRGAKDLWGEEISKEEAHENLKKECNYKELVSQDSGEIFRLSQSTRNKDTLQYEEYLQRCRMFIFNWFNVVVPLPNEQSEMFEAEMISRREPSPSAIRCGRIRCLPHNPEPPRTVEQTRAKIPRGCHSTTPLEPPAATPCGLRNRLTGCLAKDFSWMSLLRNHGHRGIINSPELFVVRV